MNARSSFLALLILVLLPACDSAVDDGLCPLTGPGECYRYVAFDALGGEAAIGFVRLDLVSSAPDRISGVWRVTAAPGGGHPAGFGAVIGIRDDDSFSASLLPQDALGGVEITGVIGSGEIEGSWVGVETSAQGTFRGTVVRPL